jgi:hypothetical protein
LFINFAGEVLLKEARAMEYDYELVRRRKPYRIVEFAAELGLSEKSVRTAIKNGKVRTFKLNEMTLIPSEELARVKSGEAA